MRSLQGVEDWEAQQKLEEALTAPAPLDLRDAVVPPGIHRNKSGGWSLNKGCRWINPNDDDDLRTRCDKN